MPLFTLPEARFVNPKPEPSIFPQQCGGSREGRIADWPLVPRVL